MLRVDFTNTASCNQGRSRLNNTNLILYCRLRETQNIPGSAWKKLIYMSIVQGESKKMSPLTKYDTIAPNLEINEIHFRDIDPDVHADSRYKNSIDRSRNV